MGGLVEPGEAWRAGQGEVQLGGDALGRGRGGCGGPSRRRNAPGRSGATGCAASRVAEHQRCLQGLARSQHDADGGVLLDQDAVRPAAPVRITAPAVVAARASAATSAPMPPLGTDRLPPWARRYMRRQDGAGRARADMAAEHGRRRRGRRRAGRPRSRRRWRRWRCTAGGAGTRAAPACPSCAAAGRGDPGSVPGPSRLRPGAAAGRAAWVPARRRSGRGARATRRRRRASGWGRPSAKAAPLPRDHDVPAIRRQARSWAGRWRRIRGRGRRGSAPAPRSG